MSAVIGTRGRNFLWFVAMVHRLSGIGLAAFLPLHFLALGLAISDDAALDGFIAWADRPWVKTAEAGLIVLLVVHFLGGLRLLVVENIRWRPRQAIVAVTIFVLAVAAGVLFLVQVFFK